MNQVFDTSVAGMCFQGYYYSRTNETWCSEMPYSVWKSIDEVEFQHYTCRKVASLKLVDGRQSLFPKYAYRSSLLRLLQEKGECDDILVIVQNGA